MSHSDRTFMAQAIRLARRGLGTTWPNPSVGAVLVRPGDPPEIVARGWTGHGGTPHGETVAIEKAGVAAAGTTLYVTLEPCSHHGRTPPCVEAVIRAGITRVVVAIEDPDPRVSGRGLARLREARLSVETGVMEKEAREVVLGHILRVAESRPAVTLKLAIGSEGLVPAGDGRPRWVTQAQARAHAHLLRARSDAILVGRETVAADDPLLTVRLPGLEDRSPIRVILDSGLNTPPTARLLGDGPAKPVWIFSGSDAAESHVNRLREAGAEIIRTDRDPDGRLALEPILTELARRGMTRVLVEGGPTVARAFLHADLVDDAIIYTGAVPAGEGGLPPAGERPIGNVLGSKRFERLGSRSLGPDRVEHFRRAR